MKSFETTFTDMPIIAILRGVTPDKIVTIGEALVRAGINIIEVPLNSPEPYKSIKALTEAFPDVITGAGTVLTAGEVKAVKAAGGQIIVSPNTDTDVIKATISEGMVPLPGFQTVTEAFQAIKAGATHIKLFPGGSLGPSYISAIKAVLPSTTRVIPVGGTGAANIKEWHAAGADGYGIGSELFKPDMALELIEARAKALVAAYKAC